MDLVKPESRVDIFQVHLLPNKLSAVLSFHPESDFAFSLYALRTDVFCIKLLEIGGLQSILAVPMAFNSRPVRQKSHTILEAHTQISDFKPTQPPFQIRLALHVLAIIYPS